MSSFWSKVKFYLGLKCVVRYEDKGWVVTKRQLGFLRVCLSNEEHYWWFGAEYFPQYCLFSTKEGAEKAAKTKMFNF